MHFMFIIKGQKGERMKRFTVTIILPNIENQTIMSVTIGTAYTPSHANKLKDNLDFKSTIDRGRLYLHKGVYRLAQKFKTELMIKKMRITTIRVRFRRHMLREVIGSRKRRRIYLS